MTKIRWPNYGYWKDYGFEHGYNERNPRSLTKSDNKKERSWYRRGEGRDWLRRFKFKRKLVRSGLKFRNFREWKRYGIQRLYTLKNQSSLQKSVDKKERSWYKKGHHNKWLKEFPFERKKVEDGYFRVLENISERLKEIIEENKGEFPNSIKLNELGYSSIGYAMRYHRGFYAVRERIGYNERKREELARELEQIILSAA